MRKDRLSPERRSWNMSRIRGKNTTPEKTVRSLLHRLGYRFRIHVRIPITLSASIGERAGLPAEGLAKEGVRCRIPRSVSVDIPDQPPPRAQEPGYCRAVPTERGRNETA